MFNYQKAIPADSNSSQKKSPISLALMHGAHYQAANIFAAISFFYLWALRPVK
jgi:hypothetical protein